MTIVDKILATHPAVLSLLLILIAFTLWAYRGNIGPVIAAILRSRFIGKKNKAREEQKKREDFEKHGNRISGLLIAEIHSYRYNSKCFAYSEDDVFSETDGFICLHRELKQECAFDFSQVKVMNKKCFRGLLDSFRKAAKDNSMTVTIVFPADIARRILLGGKEDWLFCLYKKIYEDAKRTSTLTVIIDTRAETRLTYNVNVCPMGISREPDEQRDELAGIDDD